MHPVLVVGGGLAGLAAALRLAKAGHAVQLWEATDRLGGRYAASSWSEEIFVDAAPAVIGFPAPWRDLFRKSGRTLEAELARTGAALEPADPARYEFADGSTLDLPTDRGDQFLALSRAYGEGPAARWRELLDWLDDVWQAVRPLGLEAELLDASQVSAAVRRLLHPRLTVARLADQVAHPALAALIRASAYRLGSIPERTPAWAAVTLSVERRFGRWTVTGPPADARGRTGRTSTLVEALIDRTGVRKIDVRLGHRVGRITPSGRELLVEAVGGEQTRVAAVIFTGDPWRLPQLVPGSALRRTRADLRGLRPALAPRIGHHLGGEPAERVSETIRFDPHGVPIIRYRRPVGAGSLDSVHDFTAAQPDPSTGAAWQGFRSWFRRPRVTTELAGLFFAGPQTAAGPDLSATVLAGALASYAAHEFES